MIYNPSDAARLCNVSVNTVRGWIRDFAANFSPGARGENGNRIISDRDLNTLRYIAKLRLEGLQKDAIGMRLQEVSIGETETLIDAQQNLEASNTSSATRQTVPIALESPSTAIVPIDALLSLQRQIEALAGLPAEIDALKAAKVNDRRLVRDGVFMFLAGACVSLVLVLIVIVVVDLWAK